MQDNMEPTSFGNRPLLRWALIVLTLLALGCCAFFALPYLYSFGQLAAAEISGVDTLPPQTETLTPVPATITPTFVPVATNTSIFFIPSVTPTKIPWTSCPGIVVTAQKTEQGNMIHILRCEDQLEYDLGPLSQGAYAVSPKDEFFVYASVDGALYAARIGDTTLSVVMNMKRDGNLTAFNKKVNPVFELSFTGERPYVLEVYESFYGQNLPVRMPGWLSSQ